MNQNRPVRSLEERRAILTHVGYEVWMCASAAMLLHPAYASKVADEDEAVTRVKFNALFECFLTHTRSLTEFLVRSKSGGRNVGAQDLLVSDFPETAQWKPPREAGTLTAEYEAICRHVSHLSWQRMEGERKWDYVKIATASVKVAESWNAELADSDLDLAGAMTPYLEDAQKALDSVTNYAQPGVLSATTSSRLFTMSGASGPTGPSSPIANRGQEPLGPTVPGANLPD